MRNHTTFDSPIGRITIQSEEGFITSIDLLSTEELSDSDCELLTAAKAQIIEYLDGERKAFDLPTKQDGTAFQNDVYAAMSVIPYGETMTYGELAKTAGYSGAARAVGTACKKNKLPIIVPCHRVVLSVGTGNYAYGTELKELLINTEKNNK